MKNQLLIRVWHGTAVIHGHTLCRRWWNSPSCVRLHVMCTVICPHPHPRSSPKSNKLIRPSCTTTAALWCMHLSGYGWTLPFTFGNRLSYLFCGFRRSVLLLLKQQYACSGNETSTGMTPTPPSNHSALLCVDDKTLIVAWTVRWRVKFPPLTLT